jgi:uncharacterized protein (DUF1015 family)
MRIKPFQALRPPVELAAEVASVPYDVVDRPEAAALAEGKPHSFLHVIRPEIDFPEDVDIYDDRIYAAAAANLARFQEQGILVRDDADCLYLYRQIMNGHAQRGIVACCHIDDYKTGIKIHEKTRQDKEDDRARHVRELRAHAGPVFLAYRDQATIDQLVAEAESQPPAVDLTAEDGVQHTVWVLSDPRACVAAFENVDTFYVADGHHRSASAVRVGQECRASEGGDTHAEFNWFLTVLFPASQLKILPYNRAVQDLNGLSAAELLAKMNDQFTVEPTSDPCPPASGSFCMYLESQWYLVRWTPDADADPVEALDVSVLQDRVLAPLLGIDDPRTSKRVAFVGGIRGTAELEKRVNSGRDAVAFSMFPTTMDQLMAVADADRMMPPKSTWFEPKLRSGLLVHTF